MKNLQKATKVRKYQEEAKFSVYYQASPIPTLWDPCLSGGEVAAVRA